MSAPPRTDGAEASELDVAIEKGYRSGARVAATFRSRGVTVLFGPTGTGKTTVLRCVAGLVRPDRGHVRFGGETWSDERTFVPVQRRRVGYVFQDYALFPHLTVEENVAFGLFARGAAERRGRVAALLEQFQLADLAARRPGELSGGQQQRVALARAVAIEPRLLLLDEPLAALDAPHRERLRGELRRELVRLGLPALVVTHDRNEALALGDALAVLVDGRVRQFGPVEEVLRHPADAEVARVIGTETVVAARVLGIADGLATVAIGSARLVGLDPGGLGDETFVLVRAEDVTLARGGSSVVETSARNRLEGRVTLLAPEGPLVRVTIECGFPLVALVTRGSAGELGLAEGSSVVASVKAPQVRFVPRASART